MLFASLAIFALAAATPIEPQIEQRDSLKWYNNVHQSGGACNKSATAYPYDNIVAYYCGDGGDGANGQMHEGNGDFCYQSLMENWRANSEKNYLSSDVIVRGAWVVHCHNIVTANAKSKDPNAQCAFSCTTCSVCQNSGHIDQNSDTVGNCIGGASPDKGNNNVCKGQADGAAGTENTGNAWLPATQPVPEAGSAP